MNQDNDTLDLRISNLSVEPASGLQSGSTVLVKWTVTNIGNAPTTKSFQDLGVLQNMTTGQTLVSTLVLYDQNQAANGPISPGTSRQRQVSVRLPDGPSGVGQIQFATTVNYAREVIESDPTGTNNTADVTQTSTLAPYPDLTITNLRLEPATGLTSGGHLLVRWNDANSGNGVAATAWYDLVVVKNLTTGETLFSTTVLKSRRQGR